MNTIFFVPLRPQMNLVLDIGNTVSKYYLFDGERLQGDGYEVGHSLSFISSLPTADLSAAIISTVVDLSSDARACLENLPCPLLWFHAGTPLPLVNRYRTPETLGTDRLAAAVGAWSLHPGCPMLIIDAGSCITFDFVTAKGEYLGGNISLGLHARLQAIDHFFPRLPLVEAEGPVPQLGYDTATAIRSGVIEGMRHEIQGYIDALKAKYSQLLVFLTGGDEINFENTIKSRIFADQILVPRGLNHILRYNRGCENK